MTYEKTRLWRLAFEAHDGDPHADARDRLRVSLKGARERAGQLAAEIPRAVADLTDHSVHHLDALWEMATIIAGPEIELTPLEAYVFGCAVLLHDLGNAVAAYPQGLDDLKGPEWDDLVCAAYLERFDRKPNDEEKASPAPDVVPAILLERLRQAHAEKAEELATSGFFAAGGTPRRVFIIDDDGLRESMGPLIGQVAHSHHWDVSKAGQTFDTFWGTPPLLPPEWTIDAVKVAFLLRVADAAHLDMRRAPAFTQALRRPRGTSATHWTFQSKLMRPDINKEELVFSATPFGVADRDAWWLCCDTLRMVDRELQGVDAWLRDKGKNRFAGRGVAGIGSPEALSKYIQTNSWMPLDVRVQVSDVAGLVKRFGGAKLYGEDALVPLRELVANAADAVRARRQLEGRGQHWGKITVRLGTTAALPFLEVEDTGIGMSESVLRGPLLDFGTSYWRSWLARKEHPGLLSSTFAPTGRFGIGFFSTFMAGQKVTVSTRPYQEAANATRVLELSSGPGSRPLVRSALPDESPLRDGGTRVRVDLTTGPLASGGILGPGTGDTAQEQADQLASILARLAPALDVTLTAEVAVAGGKNATAAAVKAGDWLTLPFDNLVQRLTPGDRSPSWKRTGFQTEVIRGGRTVARIGLGSPNGAKGVSVVGGFAAQEAGAFDGILLSDQPDLTRRRSRPVITPEELRGVLGEALASAAGWTLKITDRRLIAQAALDQGLRPMDLKLFLTSDGWLSAAELRGFFEGEHDFDELIVVPDVEFSVEGRFGNTHEISFEEAEGEWSHPPNVVIAGGGVPYSSSATQALLGRTNARYGISLREGTHDIADSDGDAVPTSLAALAIEAAALAWDEETPEELIQNAQRYVRTIGMYDPADSQDDIDVDVLIVHRW